MPATQDIQMSDVGLSPEQFQSHSDFEDSELVPGSSIRKRKAQCDANCSPFPSKRRLHSLPHQDHAELQEGRFLCGCSAWVSLRDENGYTLEPWMAHLRICEYSKSRGMTSIQDIMQAAVEIFPEKVIASSPFTLTAAQKFNESGMKGPNEAASPSATRTLALTFETAQMSPARGESNPHLDDIHQPPVSEKPESVKELIHEQYPSYSSATLSSTINTQSSGRRGPRQRRPHRTEAERIQDFRDDPQVADVEPYRVLCASCHKWIKLRNNSRYCSIPWTCHKACCGKARLNTIHSKSQSSIAVVASSTPDKIQYIEGDMTDSTELERGDEFQQIVHEDVASTTFPHITKIDPAVPPPNMHPSLQLNMVTLPPIIQSGLSVVIDESPKKQSVRESGSTPKGPRRARLMDAEQRRTILEADPYTDNVEPGRILCSLCKRWVKLRPNSTYCAAPWQSHIRRCIQKFEKEPLPSLRNGTKHLSADSEDGHVAKGITPDRDFTEMPRGQYYRQIPEERTESKANNNEPSRSYYKPEKALSEDPSTTSTADVPKKRRGRPPKQTVIQELPSMDNVSESDRSYESEEQ